VALLAVKGIEGNVVEEVATSESIKVLYEPILILTSTVGYHRHNILLAYDVVDLLI